MKATGSAAVVVVVAALLGGGTCQGGGRLPPPPPPLTPLFAMPARPVCAGDNAGVVDVAALLEPGLREVSGIAASLLNEDLLWLVADAGNAAALYAVSSTTGATRLQVNLPAQNIDFEDLALGPCPDLAQPCVFIADTGDNALARGTVFVYAFPEPQLAADAEAGVATLETLWVMPLQFAGGEHVDVEAIAVLPDASALILIEKTTAPVARVFAYRAPWSATLNGFDSPARELEQSGTVAVPAEGKKRERRITGASVHWSGTRMWLRYSGGLAEYAADDAVAFLDPSTLLPRQILPSPPSEEQGEALTYSADGLALFSIAEVPSGETPVLHLSACQESP